MAADEEVPRYRIIPGAAERLRDAPAAAVSDPNRQLVRHVLIGDSTGEHPAR